MIKTNLNALNTFPIGKHVINGLRSAQTEQTLNTLEERVITVIKHKKYQTTDKNQ